MLKPMVLATFFWKCQQSNLLAIALLKNCKTNGFSNMMFGHVVKPMVLPTLFFGNVVKPMVLAPVFLEMMSN